MALAAHDVDCTRSGTGHAVGEAGIGVAAGHIRHPLPCRPAEARTDRQDILKLSLATRGGVRTLSLVAVVLERRGVTAFDTGNEVAELMLQPDLSAVDGVARVDAPISAVVDIGVVVVRPVPAGMHADIHATPARGPVIRRLAALHAVGLSHGGGRNDCRAGDKSGKQSGDFHGIPHAESNLSNVPVPCRRLPLAVRSTDVWDTLERKGADAKRGRAKSLSALWNWRKSQKSFVNQYIKRESPTRFDVLRQPHCQSICAQISIIPLVLTANARRRARRDEKAVGLPARPRLPDRRDAPSELEVEAEAYGLRGGVDGRRPGCEGSGRSRHVVEGVVEVLDPRGQVGREHVLDARAGDPP